MAASALKTLRRLPGKPLLSTALVLTGLGSGAVVLAEADPQRYEMGTSIGTTLFSGGHGIVRSSRAIHAIAVNSFDYKVSVLKNRIKGGPSRPEAKSEIHLRSAQRLLRLCESNRGIYIKAGQFVASLQHLPEEYTTVLSVLQDQARCRPFHTIAAVVAEELGQTVDQLFAEFEETPIAAASLAQVHRALLKDGREVAVKVQYPGLEQQVETDLRTMALLSKAVAWIFPDYQFQWIVPEFKENLAQQLDFVHEAVNAERTAANFRHKPALRIPDIEWGLTRRRVLTMELMRGCKVDDRAAIEGQGLHPPKVAAFLLEVFAEMVFCHGHLHGDPHPGNILVNATGGEGGGFEVVLLDHGLYRDLDEGFRTDFCRLWKALILMDLQGVREMGERMGAGPYHRFLPVLFTGRAPSSKGGLGQGMTLAEAQQLRGELKRFSLGDLSVIMGGLPKDLFIIMRTDSLLRAIVSKLGAPPRLRLLTNAKYAVQGLRVNNARGGGWVARTGARVTYLHLLLRLEVWQCLSSSQEVVAEWGRAVWQWVGRMVNLCLPYKPRGRMGGRGDHATV